MALQTDYELDGQIYEGAYLRIIKVRTASVEYEYFKDVDDPNRPDIAQEMDWKIILESTATVYVWADKDGRENRAQPMKWFSFDFDYELDSVDNIYKQAYKSLKTTDEFSGSLDV